MLPPVSGGVRPSTILLFESLSSLRQPRTVPSAWACLNARQSYCAELQAMSAPRCLLSTHCCMASWTVACRSLCTGLLQQTDTERKEAGGCDERVHSSLPPVGLKQLRRRAARRSLGLATASAHPSHVVCVEGQLTLCHKVLAGTVTIFTWFLFSTSCQNL